MVSFFILLGIVLWVFLAFWPAIVARRKGYSFMLFLIMALVISWVITLIITLVLKDKNATAESRAADRAADRPGAIRGLADDDPIAARLSWHAVARRIYKNGQELLPNTRSPRARHGSGPRGARWGCSRARGRAGCGGWRGPRG